MLIEMVRRAASDGVVGGASPEVGRATVLFAGESAECVAGLLLAKQWRHSHTICLLGVGQEAKGRALAQWMFEHHVLACKLTPSSSITVDLKDCATRDTAMAMWKRNGFGADGGTRELAALQAPGQSLMLYTQAPTPSEIASRRMRYSPPIINAHRFRDELNACVMNFWTQVDELVDAEEAVDFQIVYDSLHSVKASASQRMVNLCCGGGWSNGGSDEASGEEDQGDLADAAMQASSAQVLRELGVVRHGSGESADGGGEWEAGSMVDARVVAEALKRRRRRRVALCCSRKKGQRMAGRTAQTWRSVQRSRPHAAMPATCVSAKALPSPRAATPREQSSKDLHGATERTVRTLWWRLPRIQYHMSWRMMRRLSPCGVMSAQPGITSMRTEARCKRAFRVMNSGAFAASYGQRAKVATAAIFTCLRPRCAPRGS